MRTTEQTLGRGGNGYAMAGALTTARAALSHALTTLSEQLKFETIRLKESREKPGLPKQLGIVTDLIAQIQKTVKTTLEVDEKLAPDKAAKRPDGINMDKARAEIGHRLARLSD